MHVGLFLPWSGFYWYPDVHALYEQDHKMFDNVIYPKTNQLNYFEFSDGIENQIHVNVFPLYNSTISN